MAGLTYDPERFQLSLASLKKNGIVFEVVVDPERAIAFREAKGNVTFDGIVSSQQVYADAQRGQLANEQQVKNVFQTQDLQSIIREIVLHGTLHVTKEYREKIREQKKTQAIQLLHTLTLDPSTGLAPSLARIQVAFEEHEIHIHEQKSVQAQLGAIVKQINSTLPLTYTVSEYTVTVEIAHEASVYAVLIRTSEIISVEHTSTECIVRIKLAKAAEERVVDALRVLTKGTGVITKYSKS